MKDKTPREIEAVSDQRKNGVNTTNISQKDPPNNFNVDEKWLPKYGNTTEKGVCEELAESRKLEQNLQKNGSLKGGWCHGPIVYGGVLSENALPPPQRTMGGYTPEQRRFLKNKKNIPLPPKHPTERN